jgi:hypothetical protein
MKIFYAHSSNRESIYITYDKVAKYINETCSNQCTIVDVDNNNDSCMLQEKIFSVMNECDMFICDITPDYALTNQDINDKTKYIETTYINSNVMFELGYALNHFDNKNIIILLDISVSKKIPSMLQCFDYNEYEYVNDDEYYMKIVELINKKIENFDNSKWKTKVYNLSENFIFNIKKILDITYFEYTIRINKDAKQAVILFSAKNGDTRKINILKKNLTLKNNTICLSLFENIYNELKHMEIIAHIDWFIN